MTSSPLATLNFKFHPRLIRLDPGLANAARALYGRKLQKIIINNDVFHFEFRPTLTSRVAIELHIRCAGCDYKVQIVDVNIFVNIRLALMPQVPIALQRAAVMHAFQPILHSIQSKINYDIEICDFHSEPQAWPPSTALGLMVECNSPSLGRTLRTDMLLRAIQPEGWSKLLSIESYPLHKNKVTARIPVTIFAWGEAISITKSELAGVEVGDAILLTTPVSQKEKLSVKLRTKGQYGLEIYGVLSGHFVTISSIDPSPYRTGEHENSFCTSSNEGERMTESKFNRIKNNDSERPKSSELGAMLMEIEIELARISIPICELEQLSIGQVFGTDRSIDGNGIALWCCGQKLGVGQLVAIGDNLGIRIIELNSFFFKSMNQ